jgi:hypothetical protein
MSKEKLEENAKRRMRWRGRISTADAKAPADAKYGRDEGDVLPVPAKRARRVKGGPAAVAAVAAVVGADGFFPDGTYRAIYGLRNRNRAVCHLNAVIMAVCSIGLVARIVVDQGAAAFGIGGAIRNLLVAWRHRETSVSPDGVIAALSVSASDHNDVVDIITGGGFFDEHQDPADMWRALLLALGHEVPAAAIARAFEIGVAWHRHGADDCGWSLDDGDGETRLGVHCRAEDLARVFADVEGAIIPATSHPIVACPCCTHVHGGMAKEVTLNQEGSVVYWPSVLTFVIDLHVVETGAIIALPKMFEIRSRGGDRLQYELAAWIPRAPGRDHESSEFGHCTAFVRTSDGLVHFDDDTRPAWFHEPEEEPLVAEYARLAFYRRVA